MNRNVSILVSTLSLAWASPVWAYIPPSEFILNQYVQKRAGLKSVKLRSRVTLYESERLGATHFRTTTAFSAEQGILRTWVSDDQDRKLYVAERTARNWSPLIALLLEPNLSEVTKALRAKKIPIQPTEELLKISSEDLRRESELTYLSRFQGQPAWVVARSLKGGAQYWVDKDTFFPLRLIFDRSLDNDTYDVRFEPFRQGKELSIPRAILVARGNDKLFFREEFTEVIPNFPLPPLGQAASGFTEAGNAIPSELRNLILQYIESLH